MTDRRDATSPRRQARYFSGKQIIIGAVFYLATFGLLFPPALMPQVWGQDAGGAAAAQPNREALARLQQGMPLARQAFDTIRQLRTTMPADPHDLTAIAERIGRDPKALAAHVQKHTRWVPYQGALRSLRGTLVDGSGNHLDRARLLTALLAAAGYEARLATATLDEEPAGKLLAAIAAEQAKAGGANANAASPLSQPIPQHVLDHAEKLNVSAADLRRVAVKQAVAQDRINKLAVSRIDRQTKRLGEIYGFAKDNDGAAASRQREHKAALAAVADLAWAQYKQGDAWVDLRVLPAALWAKAGDAPAAAKTHDPKALPEALQHRFAFRVIAEKWDAGHVSEHEVLDEAFNASEVHGQTLSLGIVPLDQKNGLDEGESQRDALARVATKSTVWMPVLVVGKKTYRDYGVYTDGRIEKKPSFDPKGRKFGEAAIGLGGIGRGKPKPTHLTAVWLEYRMHSPGQPDRVIRRQIFDLLGATRQQPPKSFKPTETMVLERGLMLQMHTQCLPVSGRLSPSDVATDTAERYAKHENDLLKRSYGEAAGDRAAEDAAAGAIDLPAAHLYGLALTRHRWTRDVAGLHHDQLNLFSAHTWQTLPKDSKGYGMAVAFDIVANGIGVWLPDQVAAAKAGDKAAEEVSADPRMLRVKQGVADTYAEAAVLRMAGIPVVLGSNTSDLMEITETGEGAWVKRSQQLPPPGHAWRQAQAVKAGHWIASMKDLGEDKPIPAWWETDPTTGETLGIGSNGWGAVVSGRTILETIKAALQAMTVRQFAKILACIIIAAIIATVVGLFTSAFPIWALLLINLAVEIVTTLICAAIGIREAMVAYRSSQQRAMSELVEQQAEQVAAFEARRAAAEAGEVAFDFLEEVAEVAVKKGLTK